MGIKVIKCICYLYFIITLTVVVYLIASIGYIPESPFMVGFHSSTLGQFTNGEPLDAASAGYVFGSLFLINLVLYLLIYLGVMYKNVWLARVSTYLLLFFSISKMSVFPSLVSILFIYILHSQKEYFVIKKTELDDLINI